MITRKVSAVLALRLVVVVSLSACARSNSVGLSKGHIGVDTPAGAPVLNAAIPAPLTTIPYLPAPQMRPQPATYTVVVNRVPLRELLFALARDADLNVDIIGDTGALITLNAIDQTLIKILDRISLQAPIRYQVDENSLVISADLPHLQTYAIDYLNMSRNATSRVDLATQIGSISVDIDGAADGNGSNNSQTQVHNNSSNMFWDSLVDNIEKMLSVPGAENTKELSKRVIVHRESGLISVRATHKQHVQLQHFIDRVLSSARRQALIEATVVEITLSERYQAGVDWRVLGDETGGLSLAQAFTGSGAASASTVAPNFLLSYSDPAAGVGNVLATLKLLDQFGDVQILSSPKIIALNNQTAVLKVVDNRVYFTISVDPATTDSNNVIIKPATRETQIRTVPVGFVMNVTPFISDNDEIVLNVRPSISRILGFINDPNPDLAKEGVVNRIPEIQVREMESLLRVTSGQVAIIGGLMQDKIDKRTSGIPGLSGLPLIGRAFSHQNDEVVKTELLVFLRPTVVNNASLQEDLKDFTSYLHKPVGDSGVHHRFNAG